MNSTDITRERSDGKVKLSQQAYIVLQLLNMSNSKPITVPFVAHFKLSAYLSHNSEKEMEHMSNVPFSSVLGSIMYAMVCIRPDISHAVSVVSRYTACPEKRTLGSTKVDFDISEGYC